jgi:hypothetical protein
MARERVGKQWQGVILAEPMRKNENGQYGGVERAI